MRFYHKLFQRAALSILFVAVIFLSGCHTSKKATGVPKKDKTEFKPVKTDNAYTQSLLDEAYKWLGTPYKYGGTTKKGADCSGFVQVVYKDALDIKLPRVSREMGDFCKKVDKGKMYPGDLVFFAIGKSKKVNHVGMYVGENKIIHASASKGVIISDLDTDYYKKHFHHSGMIEPYRKLVANNSKKQKGAKQNRPVRAGKQVAPMVEEWHMGKPKAPIRESKTKNKPTKPTGRIKVRVEPTDSISLGKLIENNDNNSILLPPPPEETPQPATQAPVAPVVPEAAPADSVGSVPAPRTPIEPILQE